MKQLSGATLVLLMLLMLATVLVFMCMPLGVETGSVRDGAFRLPENGGGTVYALDGDWEFVYGRLLDPEDFSTSAIRGETIQVPGAWERQGYGHQGQATYRLRVEARQAPLLLHIQQIDGAYAVWVNGALQFQNGNLGSGGENTYTFQTALLPVSPRDGELEIIVQVSNYGYFVSGPVYSLYLGEQEAVWAWYIRTRGLYALTLGGILMIAFYHLSLSLMRRSEKGYGLFSVLCLFSLLRFAFEGGGLTAMLGLGGSAMTMQQIYSTLLCLQSGMIGVFALYMFRPALCHRLRWAIRGYMGLEAAVFFLLSPHMSYGLLTLLSLASGILPGLAAAILALRAPVLRADRWMWLFFSALLLHLVIGTAFKMTLQSEWYMLGLFNNLFLILVQGLVLSRNYTRAFALVEETNENLEQIVEERTGKIKATNDAMREMIGGITHNVKAPLVDMSDTLEALVKASEGMGGDYARKAHIAWDKCRDLISLTDNLQEVNRIESGQIRYSPQWTSLPSLLSATQERYGGYLDGLGLSLVITSAVDGEVSIDPQQMWSVFDNIIYNAARYTGAGGEVSVATKAADGSVTITVRDTGCGIAPEHLPHIFQRFYKVNAGRGGEGESGVGLYIVKRVMEGMGGGAEAESVPGSGTAIHLIFHYRSR